MHWFQMAARATCLPGMAKRAGRWLLPWAGAVTVSATLTFMAGQAFARSSLDRSGASEILPARTASAAPAAPERADMTAAAGYQWALVWSENPETRVSCLTTKDRVSADMLHVHPEDLERLAAELCDVVSTVRTATASSA